MNKILSIVIPTYNMESYLHKCLSSLLIEDKELFSKLDVMIVNDGSTDASSEIAHEFEKNYPGIFRTIEKPNGNYGSCINRGLFEAQGKYIKILDADDSFDTRNLPKLLTAMSQNDVDLFISDFIMFSEDGKFNKIKTFSLPDNKILKIDVWLDRLSALQMHAVAYKTENLREINYRQSEGISYTDDEWIFIPMITVQKAYYLNNIIYKYLIGRNGQTMEEVTYNKKVTDRVIGMKREIDLYNQYLSVINSTPHMVYLKNRIHRRLRDIYLSYLIYNRDHNGASDFDSYLKTVSDKLYEYSGNIYLHKYWPYKYIKAWRKTNNLPPAFIPPVYVFLKKLFK